MTTQTQTTQHDETCPHCGQPNPLAREDGAVEGPREYHADCWAAAAAKMTDEQVREAWERSPFPA